MDDIKVAAVCMNSTPGEVERNLVQVESFVSRAAADSVDIICFPELSISGYATENPDRLYSASLFHRIVDRISDLAGAAGLLILAGAIEIIPDGKPYITQIVAGPQGLLGCYRKTHLSPPEKKAYAAGQTLGLFHYGGVTFGLQLCYEAHFPEISTVMALGGADVILMPHASPWGTPEEKLRSWLRHLPGRAFDNGLFVVACNQVGKTPQGLSFPGVALGLGPAGRLIAKYTGPREDMLSVVLKGEELRNVREHRMAYFLPHRRPELYRGVLQTLEQTVWASEAVLAGDR
jgi:N-carbamoylputrescine amidase